MDYNLEKKIFIKEIINETNHGLWSLQELGEDTNSAVCDFKPYELSTYFSASELRYNYWIETNQSHSAKVDIENESITGTLFSGMCNDGNNLVNDVIYKMFGTERTISDITLYIRKANKGVDKQSCILNGCPSYTSEIDGETTEDDLYLEILLPIQQFNKVVELINSNLIDIFTIFLNDVPGFYSEHSLFPFPQSKIIKVLADEKYHKVLSKDNCGVKPLRIGNVMSFELTTTQRLKLDVKQNLSRIDIEKIFDDTYQCEENKIEKEEIDSKINEAIDILSQMSSQLTRNCELLRKLVIPIWLIFIILIYNLLA